MVRECANTGFQDRWTCPSCLWDLGNVGPGQHVCPSCACTVTCTLRQIPECHAALSGTCQKCGGNCDPDWGCDSNF